MSYALGITLQPGEEISMLHHISYSNFASIRERATEVNAPTIPSLMLLGLGILVFRRKYL